MTIDLWIPLLLCALFGLFVMVCVLLTLICALKLRIDDVERRALGYVTLE